MIQLDSVTKYYDVNDGERHYVFNDVSFTLPEDKHIGILGLNGAGKSTLLRMIGGSEKPNSGEIITDCSISWSLGLAGGFQGTLTAAENIAFVCRVHGLDKEESLAVKEFVRDFAEIGDYFEMPMKTYSSGMRARIVFGLSMAFKFDVYLVDEITAVGDALFRSKAENAFLELRDRASLIYVTHNLHSIAEICDVGIVIDEGELKLFNAIDDAIAHFEHKVLTPSVS